MIVVAVEFEGAVPQQKGPQVLYLRYLENVFERQRQSQEASLLKSKLSITHGEVCYTLFPRSLLWNCALLVNFRL